MSYGIRRKFYSSKAWKDVKKAVWLRQHLLCSKCGLPIYVDGISEYIPKEKRRTGIVHHIEHLNDNNVYDKNIALNEDNLEGVCLSCHNLLHNNGSAIRPDYIFDANGNVIPVKDNK